MRKSPGTPCRTLDVDMARATNESSGSARRHGDGRHAVARRDASVHEEWLLDEALKETFPASDPISPANPAPRRGRTLKATVTKDEGAPPARHGAR